MKKISIWFLMIILALPIVFSTPTDIQFGGNISRTTNVSLYCGFNQSDSSILQNCMSGQTLTEKQGNTQILNNRFLDDGPGNQETCINVPNLNDSSTVTDLWSAWYVVSPPSTTGTNIRYEFRTTANCGNTNILSVGSYNFGGDPKDNELIIRWNAGATNSLYTPEIFWVPYYQDTTILIQIVFDRANDRINSTVYNFTANGNSYTLKTLASMSWISAVGIDNIQSINIFGGGDVTRYTNEMIIFNGTSLTQYPSELITSNFEITAQDSQTANMIYNFTAIISNSSYSINISTTNGTIPLPTLTIGDYNIQLYMINDSGGYFDKNYTNYDISVNLTATLNKYYFYYLNYYNFSSINNKNYTRNLAYRINITCPSFSTTYLYVYSNDTYRNNYQINCIDNAFFIFNNSYTYFIEGNFSFYFRINTTINSQVNNIQIPNRQDFTSDLYPPQVSMLNYSVPKYFNNNIINLTMQCIDNIYPNLNYSLLLNNISIHTSNYSNGTIIINATNLNDGSNVLLGICRDAFGNNSLEISNNIFFRAIFLIDEKDNVIFNLENISLARAYFDDNQTYIDFKVLNQTNANFSLIDTGNLRFEFGIYPSEQVINRYINLRLVDGDLRVCVNKQDISHNPQLITSVNQKASVTKNPYSNCIISADYSRFAYQGSYILQSFTINSIYYLYTFDENENQILLASIDGSISTYQDLDQLEFMQQAYNLNIQQDALVAKQYATNEIQIYYNNLKGDNEELSLEILEANSSISLFAFSEFTDPNEFTLYFDYSVYGLDNSSLLKLVLTKTLTDGSTSVITRYYYPQSSKVGVLNTKLAAIFSLFITIFGLSFLAARNVLGWFGVFIELISIGILTFAASAWYITFLMALNVIIIIFIVVMLTSKNYPTITS